MYLCVCMYVCTYCMCACVTVWMCERVNECMNVWMCIHIPTRFLFQFLYIKFLHMTTEFTLWSDRCWTLWLILKTEMHPSQRLHQSRPSKIHIKDPIDHKFLDLQNMGPPTLPSTNFISSLFLGGHPWPASLWHPTSGRLNPTIGRWRISLSVPGLIRWQKPLWKFLVQFLAENWKVAGVGKRDPSQHLSERYRKNIYIYIYHLKNLKHPL